MSRIAATFASLKKENRAGLVTFIMGGDPDVKTAQELLDALPEAGTDLIEIGMPFSDPMADGPVIQAAGLRALKSGTKVKDILAMVKAFRQKNDTTPVILMGYYNPVYHYGVEKFCADAAKAGVDGIILVDLPPEEEGEFKPDADKVGLDFIRLVAPTSLETRAKLLVESARGFIYYIAVAGITGAKSANIGELEQQVKTLRSHTKLPIAVGFGIKTPAQAAQVAAFSDAVVVGSALVDTLEKKGAKAALQLVQQLRQAVHR